jgi:hypothetical protein
MGRFALVLFLCALLPACPQGAVAASPPVDVGPVCPQVAGPRTVKLLTRAELDRTLRDLLGDETRPAQALPPETAIIGFENDGDNHRATALLVEDLLALAEDVAARAVAERRELVLSCDASVVGEPACGTALVEELGPRAFRRPLTAAERDRLLGVFSGALTAYGFDKALELTLTTMLVSPAFLYRVDAPLGSSRDGGEDGGGELVGSFEMASRLSYFLWGTMPDDALLEAAARGELIDAPGVETQARRMLDDARAREAVGSFFRQWLGLDRLDGVTKDTTLFPEYSSDLNALWRDSVLAFVDGVVWEGTGTLEELFTSPTLHVNPLMASIYGVAGPDHAGLDATDAPAGTRAGLLTQPGLMALLANPDQSSPIRRGVFVREKLLCQPIDPPPPDVVIEPPPASPGRTTRERFAIHTENEQCAACHVLIDPIGFGFEAYDALGRFRTSENGAPIDDAGELAFTNDAIIEGRYDGALELSQKLAGSPQVRDCVMGQAFTFAMGRVPDAADQCALDEISARFADGGSLREMLVAIAVSKAFRTVAP